MPIKYGEICVIHVAKHERFINYFYREWVGYEVMADKLSPVIILFEDEHVFQITDKLTVLGYNYSYY